MYLTGVKKVQICPFKGSLCSRDKLLYPKGTILNNFFAVCMINVLIRHCCIQYRYCYEIIHELRNVRPTISSLSTVLRTAGSTCWPNAGRT